MMETYGRWSIRFNGSKYEVFDSLEAHCFEVLNNHEAIWFAERLWQCDKLEAIDRRVIQQQEVTHGRGKTLCIDFDGVIHDYRDGWQDGVIYGGVLPDAMFWLDKLNKAGYDLVILSTRANHPEQAEAMRTVIDLWQEEAGVVFKYRITGTKVPALAYIDDRAIRFTSWNDIGKIYT